MESWFHFHDELNDFLPKERRETLFSILFESHQSVKHLFESLGIPHTEVGRILANGAPVDFDYLPQEGDRVDIYPASQGLQDRYSQPPAPRFVLDNHLGRLAAYLRMLGFDSLYRNDYGDEELAATAAREERILLTRDRRLLMRKAVHYGYWVRAKTPRQQIAEVLKRFNLEKAVTPFQRCLRCNGQLQPVSKEEVLDRLEPLTRRYYDEFHLCPACGQVYWKGSHYARMLKLMEGLQLIRR